MSVLRKLLPFSLVLALAFPVSADCCHYTYCSFGCGPVYHVSSCCDPCGEVVCTAPDIDCSFPAECGSSIESFCGSSSTCDSSSGCYSSLESKVSSVEIEPSSEEQSLAPVAEDFATDSTAINDPAPVAVPEVEESVIAEDPIAPIEESVPNAIEDKTDDIFDEPELDSSPSNDGGEIDESNIPVEGESVEDDLEDIFGDHKLFKTLKQDGGLASQSVRLWTDNTGRYQCEARLLITAGRTITLVKSNGAKKEVSLSRLSEKDLLFVQRQALAYNDLLASDSAIEKIALLMKK